MTRDEKMTLVNLAAEATYSAFAKRNKHWDMLEMEKRADWRRWQAYAPSQAYPTFSTGRL